MELKQISPAGQIWSESWREVGGGGGRSQGPGGPAYAGEGGGPGGAGATKHQPQVRDQTPSSGYGLPNINLRSEADNTNLRSGAIQHQTKLRGYSTPTSSQSLPKVSLPRTNLCQGSF